MTAQPEQHDDSWHFSDIDNAARQLDVDLSFFAAPYAYATDNEVAQAYRRQLEVALPRHLSVEQVAMLGRNMYRTAHAFASEAGDRQPHAEAHRSEVRFLRWLGDTATRDPQTAHNVKTVLRHDHGARGKFAAASLTLRMFFDY